MLENSVIFNKIQSIRKQDENQLNTHKCVWKSEVYVFFFLFDTTKNLEKPPKIQSKFEFMNEQVPKFSFKKLIHLSTQNLNLGLEFKTGQNHPVNRTKNNTALWWTQDFQNQIFFIALGNYPGFWASVIFSPVYRMILSCFEFQSEIQILSWKMDKFLRWKFRGLVHS